jgi:glycerol-3-phosphate dehydrogenase (NAD(P)+)
MANSEEKICVLGAGSWGTALANILSLNGHNVKIWSIESEVLDDINRNFRNEKYHPGYELDKRIRACHDIKEATRGCTYILNVLPTQTVREVLRQAKESIDVGCPIISASKGIENTSLKTVSQIILEECENIKRQNIAVLSGPSFAKEVMDNLPTAVSIACGGVQEGLRIQKLFHTDKFRTYTTDDIAGVELGGALKNVIAIGVGVSDGLKMGHNARAALITRGAAEITRLGIAKGANPLTFLGLSGMGDLILTCTSELSRNRTVGFKIGSGGNLKVILGEMEQVVEGVKTAKSAYNLSKKLDVPMPITKEVYQLIYEGKSPEKIIQDLTHRDPKQERYQNNV